MKKPFLLIAILIAVSCKQEIQPMDAIYAEWKWVMTTLDTRGQPITAQESDTTYFYRFTRAGQLELRDVNRVLKQQVNFTLIRGESFNKVLIDEWDLVWGYSINNDTLRIWEPASIFPRITYFKRN
jgi:hypothetical protein